VLYRMVAMSNILQSSLSSCWRVLLQTFLSPDSALAGHLTTQCLILSLPLRKHLLANNEVGRLWLTA